MMGPVALTLVLAGLTTVILLMIAIPLGWWLATTRARLRPLVEAITTMPLVLPPTVLGFYLLILMAPDAPLGALWVRLTGDSLSFSFAGLVLASVIYSLPFAVQPISSAFSAMGRAPIEMARTLGATRLDAFLSVALPMTRRGMLTAAVLSFAHTVGEFGVVLMVGGNIPGRTKVISIAIYEHVETLNYGSAHRLSLGLMAFALITLLVVFAINSRTARAHG
ncbi:MAG: molybdate ABC transporter permease subunit [Pseudomonadota bacterium]